MYPWYALSPLLFFLSVLIAITSLISIPIYLGRGWILTPISISISNYLERGSVLTSTNDLSTITSTASTTIYTTLNSDVAALGGHHVSVFSSNSARPEKPERTPQQVLLAAAAAGLSKEVESILKQGEVKPTVCDTQGRTPLHLAAQNGDTKTIALLLKYENTRWKAEDDITPLHLAAMNGHIAAVKQIISQKRGHAWSEERAKDERAVGKLKQAMGHKFDEQFKSFFSKHTWTARDLAVIYGHESTALSFPSASGDDLLHALSCACMLGNANMVEALWLQYENRRFYKKLKRADQHVRWFPAPPLHLAVMSGNPETVAFLLEKGVKANSQRSKSSRKWPSYSSPAHYAAMIGSTGLLKALYRRHADLTALDHISRTPLSYAVEKLHDSAVEYLMMQEYPKRTSFLSFWVSTEKAKSSSYFGDRDIWKSKLRVVAFSSTRIKRALEDVGFTFW